MQLPLKGIIPPLITPLLNYDKLDVQGLHNLIEHLISGRVHGLFILGTNGEAASLSYDLRKEVIKRTCEQVNHRIPVLVGITDTSIAGLLELSEYSKSSGADAVVVAPPFYFPLDQEEIVDYYKVLASSLSLPFILYNIPSHTKVHLPVDTVIRMKELGALGIKDSSGDLLYLYSLIEAFRDLPEFSVITGTELFLPETIFYGGHGAIPGGANIFPQLFVKLYEASVNKDFDTIVYLREKVMKLNNTIYKVSKNPSRITIGTKCALSVMGICNDYMVPPLHKMKPEERELIEKIVETFSKIHV